MSTLGVSMCQVRPRPRMRRSSTSAWRSAACSYAQSPAKKPPTKAGLGLQGRPSPVEAVEGSGPTGAVQPVVDSNYRPADMSAGQQTCRPASTAFIVRHPSGAPGVASPNGCQPTKAGRMPAQQHIIAKNCLIEHSVFRARFQAGTSQRV